MRLLDAIRGAYRDRRDLDELRFLANKVYDGRGMRNGVITRSSIPSLAGDLVDFEGVYSSWSHPQNPTPADIVQFTQLFKHLIALREGGGVERALVDLLQPLDSCFPNLPTGEDFGLSVTVLE